MTPTDLSADDDPARLATMACWAVFVGRTDRDSHSADPPDWMSAHMISAWRPSMVPTARGSHTTWPVRVAR
jgi:hypothetical protein